MFNLGSANKSQITSQLNWWSEGVRENSPLSGAYISFTITDCFETQLQLICSSVMENCYITKDS